MPEYVVKERPSPRTVAPNDERMSRAQRWVVWNLRAIPGKPKPSKVPTGRSNDPSTWTFFAAARHALEDQRITGLGFQMFGKPELIAIDIDHCIGEAGEYNSLASQLLALLQAAGGKYHVEITPSGVGLRIFAGETPLPFHDYLNHDAGLEVYAGETARFLTYTGSMVPGWGEGPFAPLSPDAVAFLAKYATRMKSGVKTSDGVVIEGAEPLPELSRREDWKALHPVALKRMGVEHRAFLEHGSLGKKYASLSEHMFAVEQTLIKHLKPAEAYQILISADGSYGVAMEHRENSERKAFEFIWSDLQRAVASREKHSEEKAVTSAGWKDCDIIVTMTEEGAKARLLQINQLNALQKHPEWVNRLAYNVFDGRVTLDRKDCSVREVVEMSAWLTQFLRWEYEPPRPQFEESLITVAKTRPWNPVEEELRGLVWDGKSRLGKFTEALTGADGDLDRDILKKWLVGYIARGIAPGCQMDTVLCLREKEGGGFKTTFARVMAGSMDRFSDSPGFGSDKESALLRCGMRVIELSEGIAVRKSDRHALKQDTVKLDDHFRPLWGKETDKRKRGFVYILTANDIAFLRSDQDGLRRIWPMDCAAVIDIKWIKENRDQMLAEAVSLYDAGFQWWWDKGKEPDELKSRQFSAVSEDFLDGPVQAVIADSERRALGYTTLVDVKKDVEAMAGVVLNTGQAQHLLDVMGKHGLRAGQMRIEGAIKRVWLHDAWTPTVHDTKQGGKVLEMPKRTALYRPVPEGGGTDILE